MCRIDRLQETNQSQLHDSITLLQDQCNTINDHLLVSFEYKSETIDTTIDLPDDAIHHEDELLKSIHQELNVVLGVKVNKDASLGCVEFLSKSMIIDQCEQFKAKTQECDDWMHIMSCNLRNM